MKNLLKNRMALSTVVTTLIILVVSVLLAGVVTYFAINVTSTRVQEESLQITKLHVWCPGTVAAATPTEAAFLIINTGGRDVVINKITVRGQSSTFAAGGAHPVYYGVTDKAVTIDFAWITHANIAAKGPDPDPDVEASTNGVLNVNTNATPDYVHLTAATSDLTLTSGNSMIVYIESPDSITINDIGLTVGITVFTSQAMYYQEANVEAT